MTTQENPIDEAESRANTFLRLIRRSQQGRLKIYLGYCPGVGKTYQMLQEGHRLKEDGIDVVIGLLETHGRADIEKLAEGLVMIPREHQEYRGIVVEEMDTDAILARRPQVALIDELAHTNVPGARNPKRYQDIQDILAAGIHVITTVNVQHLESLYNVIEKAVGVKVRERLPDSVLAGADQIVDVDLTAEDLRRRLQSGKIYPSDRVEASLLNFFTYSNLERLRELTLRELASQLDLRRREEPEEKPTVAPDQIMVCLSSHGPNSEKLLRYASRLAGRLNRNWYAVYVQTPSEEATVIDARTQRLISDTLTLAKQLGAMVFTYKGEDVADTILRFAKEYLVGHIVIGKPRPRPFWKRFGRNNDIVGNLIRRAKGVTVAVLDTSDEDAWGLKPNAPLPATPAPAKAEPADREPLDLSGLISADRILLWEHAITKEEALRALTGTIAKEGGPIDPGELYAAILTREAQGSTFFNEGAAFPHVRLPGLPAPLVALGLAKQGISDVSTEKPVQLVFLILTPEEKPEVQIRILGMVSRATQNRHLFQSLALAGTSGEAFGLVETWETSLNSTQ
ncbi:MAG TPA: PTS sugar transporter subunit IIA [Syntrophorhabdaceae bacterium]